MAMLYIHMTSVIYSLVGALVTNSSVEIDAYDLAKIGVLVAEAVVRHREQKKARKAEAPKS